MTLTLQQQIKALKYALECKNCYECDHWIEEGNEKTKQNMR